MAEKKSIQSVVRALEILEYLVDNGDKCRLQDISEGLNLNKSTVYTLLSTLEQKGYVEHDADSPRYSLGLSCWQLGAISRRNMFPSIKSRWLLEQLVDSLEETCCFVFPCGQQYFYIDGITPSRSVSADSRIGSFQSMNRECAISRLFRLWSTDSEHCPEYTFDEGEDQPGVNALAMPLVVNGKLIGIFAVYGIASRFTSDKAAPAYELYKKLRTTVLSEDFHE